MASVEGTESGLAKHTAENPATEQWMEEVCERENCKQALRRVKANKGSPGIDGITVEKLSGVGDHFPMPILFRTTAIASPVELKPLGISFQRTRGKLQPFRRSPRVAVSRATEAALCGEKRSSNHGNGDDE
jgi:hypothetical protein